MCSVERAMPPLSRESGSAKFVNVAGAGQRAQIVSGAVARKGRKHFAAPRVNVRFWGRAPPSQGTASCPTERRPAPQQGSRKPPNAKLFQQVVLEALRSMDLPLELMQQLQNTLAPPAHPEKPAKRLPDLQIKLDRGSAGGG